MSKRFGINTKSAEARQRKEIIKQINEKEKREKLEEEFWKDDDKHFIRKQQRKEEKEKKENDKIQRKQEISKLLEDEELTLMKRKSSKHVELIPKKMTQIQIQEKQIDFNQTNNEERKSKNLNENQIDLEENPNHQQLDEHSARNIDQAIQILKIDSRLSSSIDNHPEKRLKSSYQIFEEKTLPKLKEENPTLRLSQLKQLLKKEWMKSNENPFNRSSINIQHNNEQD